MDQLENFSSTAVTEEKQGIGLGGKFQYLILINGLILTLTAFFVLDYAAKQIGQDDYARAVADTHESLSQRVTDLEYILRTSATILAETANEDEAEIQAKLMYAVPDYRFLDRLYRLHVDAQEWVLSDIYRNPDTYSIELIDPAVREALIDLVLDQASDHQSVFVMTTVPGTRYLQEMDMPVVRARPFIIARPIRDAQGEIVQIVVALTRLSLVLDADWRASKTHIDRLIVRDPDTNETIYLLDRTVEYTGMGEEQASDYLFSLEIGNGAWRFLVDFRQDIRTLLLAQAPWMLLVFGLMLTLMGMFYVRNNHIQAAKLAILSRAMVQKNYELSSEITERERLNQVLRKAEREYKAIVDSVSDIIFEANMHGEIIFLNAAWEKITGFELDSSIGRNLFELLHAQDQEEQRTAFLDLVKGKRHAYRAFVRIRTSEGVYRSVEMSVSMLRQDENRRTRVVGSFTDVEERRRAEKALSEAEKKYRTIVENAAGGIFQMTPEGQFISANPAMARILGYSTPEQMIAEIDDALALIFASSRDRARFVKDVDADGLIKNFEIQTKTRTGDKIWLNIHVRAVCDDERQILYYEGSLEEITDRKSAELKLREAKIQSDLANRAKSEFLANMSHELRTPLNAIIGFSEIIKDEVLGPVSNRQYWEYSNDIYQSGARLLNIINDILDVSRIEAGDRHLNESVIDVRKLVQSSLEFIGPRAEEGKLKISNMVDGDDIPQLIGEALAVKQILLNLLSNAVKYTPEGGRITLSYEVDGEGQLRLSVTDTGVGLNETEIEKALSPFGQVDSAFSRSGSGTGLGLTLVDSLIRMHNGRLELFSQKGIGTTATVIFPASRVGGDAEKVEDSGNIENSRAKLQPDEVESAYTDSNEPQPDIFAPDVMKALSEKMAEQEKQCGRETPSDVPRKSDEKAGSR